MSSTGRKQLSRREFLKNAAAVSAGAVAAGTLGSSPAQAQTVPGLPAKWDKEVDVVVAGASGPGLAAAIEAKTAGADVLVVEKADHEGGLFIHAGGHSILGGTHVQEKAGIKDTLDMWYEDEMRASDWRAVPEIVRTYVQKGPETCLWLEKLGLVWSMRPTSISFGHRVNRSMNSTVSKDNPALQGFGYDYIYVLQKEAKRLGITPTLLQHRLTKIYRQPNGPVVGIEVKTPTGTLNIKARKGVVLATGGTVDNTRMCMANDPRFGPTEDIMGDAGGAPGSGGPYNENTGDAHLAAMDIGADLADMHSYVAFLAFRLGSKPYMLWEPRDWTKPPAIRSTGLGGVNGDGLQRVIWVKADGKRYVNEAWGAMPVERTIGGTGKNFQKPGAWTVELDPYEPNVMEGLGAGQLPHEFPEHPFMQALLNLKERPRNVWVVTDADGAAAIKWPEQVMRNPKPLASPGLYPDSVAVADTIAQLAAMMKIDPAGLAATITRYNGFVDAGKDADFAKPLPLFKIAKPPFFGAKANLLRHTQPGGIRINTKAQVIERNDQLDGREGVPIDKEKVIPHLYAAGEVSAFLGWRRNHGRLGDCITFGRIAGQNAAKEAPAA